MKRLALGICILFLSVLLAACGAEPTPTEVAVVPTRTPRPADTPTATSTPTLVPTPTVTLLPTATATATAIPTLRPLPQTLEEWAWATEPSDALLASAKSAYARALGVSVESIRALVRIHEGVHGPFAVILDEETGIPLLISSETGMREWAWELATLGNTAEQKGISFGAMLNLTREFLPITTQDFESGTAVVGWETVQPAKGQYEFADPDYNVTTALQHGMIVGGGTGVWGQSVPEWVRQEEDLRTVMADHINHVVAHYKGKFSFWIVYNEAGNRGIDVFWNALGMGGVRDAFSTTRNLDPGAKLLYNDYVVLDGVGQEGRDRLPTIEAVVAQLKLDGTIDGIGLQVVGRMSTFDLDELTMTLEVLKEYELPIYVSEFSIIIGGENTAENLRKQATVGGEVIRVLRESGSVVQITAWGLEDRLTNKIYFENANAGLYLDAHDGTFTPKPIVYAMMAALVADE